MTKRLPVVGVLGSGDHEHADKAESVGRWLAAQEVHLLTGAGKGVMEAVSRAFCRGARPRRPGRRHRSVRRRSGRAAAGYPNPFVELAILTHLPLSGVSGTDALSRNHINVLSSNVLIALPGGAGTASEVALALRYRRPIAAFVDKRTDIPQLPDAVPVLGTLSDVQDFVRRSLGRA